MRQICAGAVAVIFTSQRTALDPEGYSAAATEMDAAAAAMPGYIGMRAARDDDGFGITVSYWRDTASAKAWRDDPRHSEIRAEGRARWYSRYEVVVATIDRAYDWQA
jgi:heme-degrading monooxygenase HmoA